MATLVAERRKEAFSQLRDRIGPFVFMNTHVFVQSPGGTELVNPVRPALGGRHLMDLRDLQGKAVIRDQNTLSHGYTNGQLYAASGLLSFNGRRQVAVIYTSSIERAELATSGTYTVNGNCSGSITLAVGTVNNLYLSPSGDHFNFVRVSAEGDTIGGEAKRLTRGLIVKQP